MLRTIILLLLSVTSISCAAEEEICCGNGTQKTQVNVVAHPKVGIGKISNLLTGVNLVYCFEDDARWKDGSVSMETLQSVKSGILRYPGGLVNKWHWDKPNGWFLDSWKPGYDSSTDKKPEEMMDLDEYMKVVRQLDAEPLVGINIASGLLYKGGPQPTVDEAKALVRYCVDHDFGVRYYYIGNEPYVAHSDLYQTAEEYAVEVNRYADAIHEVDPQAQIVANWTSHFDHTYSTLLKLAGKNIDIIDVHWYWLWGHATWENWRLQTKMTTTTQWYKGGNYMEEIAKFRSISHAEGFDDIRLAAFEWNIGPSSESWDEMNPTDYQIAVMQGEMFMQMMKGGLDMATFWPMSWPDPKCNRYFMDASKDYQPSELVPLMSMFSELMGENQMEVDADQADLLPILVRRSDRQFTLCLFNKNGASRICGISGFDETATYTASCYHKAGKAELSQISAIPCEEVEGKPSFELPPYSFTFIDINL